MWIAVDTETYEFYDGTQESEDYIISQMLTNEAKKDFRKNKIKNSWYPVLNSRKFCLGCAITDKGEKRIFENYKEMWSWLIRQIEEEAKKGKRTFIYGHNIEYDFYAFGKDDLLNPNLKVINYSPFLGTWFCKGKRKDKEIKDNWGFFLDSWSFFRMSLSDVGNIFKTPKLKMPERVENVRQLDDYLIRDTELVLKGMLEIKEQLKVLGFTPRKFLTAGQVAMTTFMSYIRKKNLHWGMMKSGEVFKGEHLEKCRPAYRGGRNEALRTGKIENVTQIDINSLYPYAMAKMPFPKLDEEIFLENPLKDLSIKEILAEHLIGVAECEIEVPKIKLGYLPIRLNKKLHFPTTHYSLKKNNRMIGTWTTLELKKALSLGYKILKMNWCCLYPVMKKNLFSDYVNELYELRRTSEPEMKLVVKIILNNLYGKFAQFRTNKDFRVINRWELSKYKKLGWEKKSVWLNKYIITKDNEIYVPKYTNLLLAILTTAYARDYFYSFLEKIPFEDLIYMDTDGVIFKGNHLDKIPVSDKLGDFKIVQENVSCYIKGEKDYRIGEDKHVAGVSKKVIDELDFDKEVVVMQKRKIGLKDGLNDPNRFLHKVGEFQDFEIKLFGGCKKDEFIPPFIDERKDWVDIFA